MDERKANPDTYDELLEAMKHFDKDCDGKIPVPELRLILSALGDRMDEALADEIEKELDKEKTGFIGIESYSKMCFGIKEDKPKDDKAKKAEGGKKKKKKWDHKNKKQYLEV